MRRYLQSLPIIKQKQKHRHCCHGDDDHLGEYDFTINNRLYDAATDSPLNSPDVNEVETYTCSHYSQQSLQCEAVLISAHELF